MLNLKELEAKAEMELEEIYNNLINEEFEDMKIVDSKHINLQIFNQIAISIKEEDCIVIDYEINDNDNNEIYFSQLTAPFNMRIREWFRKMLEYIHKEEEALEREKLYNRKHYGYYGII